MESVYRSDKFDAGLFEGSLGQQQAFNTGTTYEFPKV